MEVPAKSVAPSVTRRSRLLNHRARPPAGPVAVTDGTARHEEDRVHACLWDPTALVQTPPPPSWVPFIPLATPAAALGI